MRTKPRFAYKAGRLARIIGKQEPSHCPSDSAGLYNCRSDQGFKHSARDDALIRELGRRRYKGNVDGYRVGNQPNDSGVERDKQATDDEKHVPALLFLPYGWVEAGELFVRFLCEIDCSATACQLTHLRATYLSLLPRPPLPHDHFAFSAILLSENDVTVFARGASSQPE